MSKTTSTKPAKPLLQSISFYDWSAAWEYLKEKYNLVDDCVPYNEDSDEYSDIWNYICDTKDIHNGVIFSFSNWELIHQNGKFAHTVPDWFKPILNHIIEEFGELDKGCTTPGTKIAEFRSEW